MMNQAQNNIQLPRRLINVRGPQSRTPAHMKVPHITFVGGQIVYIRRPDLGETPLSEAEMEIAVAKGISA